MSSPIDVTVLGKERDTGVATVESPLSYNMGPFKGRIGTLSQSPPLLPSSLYEGITFTGEALKYTSPQFFPGIVQ